MSVRLAIRKVLSEYLSGKRDLDDCAVPDVKWHSLRRVLLATKVHQDAHNSDHNKSFLLIEKKRAESRFWLDTGIKWPAEGKDD